MHTIEHMPAAARQAFNTLRAHLEPELRTACSARDADLFLIRLSRSFSDLYLPLHKIYGFRPDFQELDYLMTLGTMMLHYYTARPEHMRVLDMERMVSPDWFQHETMIGYTCYADLFAGSLHGMLEHLNYLQEMGIRYVRVLPAVSPRAGLYKGWRTNDKDQPATELGRMEDLAMLAQELHTRGMCLCVDLTVNHTTHDHEWAMQAKKGNWTYIDYYLTFDDRSTLDAYESSLREVYPELAPGNFTWVSEITKKGRWVWTTFHSHQWDLNYRNPAVFRDMVDNMLSLANQGIDVLRLDALPYIWKNVGTNCENQPEMHQLVQAFRAAVRIVAPGVLFEAETNAPPDKLVAYMGIGPSAGRECDLVGHSQLMALLWSTLASRRVGLMTSMLTHMHLLPPGTSWVTYIRNHEEITWSITDEYSNPVGEDAGMHQHFLNDFYAGKYAGSFARGALFQPNAETQEARISGTTSSLAGLERALQSGDFYQMGLAVRRIMLLYSVVMATGGIPVIAMGDELGMLNDMSFAQDPDRAKDNRWMHRPRMDWDMVAQCHDRHGIVAHMFEGLCHLAQVRASTPELRADAMSTPLVTDNEHVFALARRHARGPFLLLANFHEHAQTVSARLLEQAGLRGTVCNVLGKENQDVPITDWRICLEPYESMWLVSDV